MKCRIVTFCMILLSMPAMAVRPLSQYGQIQNVQNYSSNPFWSPNAPYNQKMPSAVYVTGPDVGSSDCSRTVASIIASQCSRMNNCYGKTLSDIRPNVIVELSRMPGHNFATACAGYIDSEFDNYMRGVANVPQPTAFPTATAPSANATQNTSNSQITIPALEQNAAPKWKTESDNRAEKLAALQAQTADPGANRITATEFPETINDVSFTDRMQNAAVGYAPYKDATAYKSIKVETPEAALARQIAILEQQRSIDATTMSDAQYCDKYPLDATKCQQTPGLLEQVIAIGNAAPTQNPPVTQETSTTPNNQEPQTTIIPPSQNTTVIADNKTRGGACTPSSKSKWFPNKILTSGKYENIDPAFEKAMVQFFRMEGECGYHPADRGGYTCYGFAQNANPDIDVRKLTRPAAEDRTYERIYKANGIDKLPDSVRGDVLRGWFGSGYYGVQQMQKVLGLPTTKTGRVDDQMAAAAMNYDGDLHKAYWDQMQKYYVSITERNPSQKVFLKGWMNGVKLMRENGCHVTPTEPLTR